MNVFRASKDEALWSPTTEGSTRRHDSLTLSLSRETILSSSKARTTQSRGLKQRLDAATALTRLLCSVTVTSDKKLPSGKGVRWEGAT